MGLPAADPTCRNAWPPASEVDLGQIAPGCGMEPVSRLRYPRTCVSGTSHTVLAGGSITPDVRATGV